MRNTLLEEYMASLNGPNLIRKEMQALNSMTHTMLRFNAMMFCGRASILGHPRPSPILR